MAAQKTAQDVMDGEDAIVSSMRRFANDAKCVDNLKEFKSETETKMGEYKQAMVLKMKAGYILAPVQLVADKRLLYPYSFTSLVMAGIMRQEFMSYVWL